MTLGRVPTPTALPLSPALPNAKGPQAGQQLLSGRRQEPWGWQGFVPPGSAAACALCQDALHLCTYRIKGGQAPRLPREEEEGGQEAPYAELDRRAHHPVSQRSASLPVHRQRSPRPGLVVGEASRGLGQKSWVLGGPAVWHGPGRLEAPAVPRSFPQALRARPSVRVSRYYVSAYKSTLLWGGGGGRMEDRCSCVNAISILPLLGD